MEPKQQIAALRKTLPEHNYKYYVLDSPTISDFEFDKKLETLKQLEASHPEFYDPNSPTQRVGGTITKNFPTVVHDFRMYSLDNSYSKEDVLQWEKRLKKIIDDPIEFVCELKYDGASMNITYENGNFLRAVTRGDGVQGDEVSANVKTIATVPLKLQGDFPPRFDIQGEIVLPIKGFEIMNQARLANGEEPYRNPRNTASGSLKLQDSSEVSKRPLECLLYNIRAEDLPFSTHFESLKKAKQWGFNVPSHAVLAKTIDEVFNYIAHWETHRHELPYETDGIVIKVNNLDQQTRLGFTAKAPRWALAYKFKAEATQTKLESVVYQVGRTGAITPVDNLPPVTLEGTVVKRASLHNADQIVKLDLCLGDMVYVEKGGEIIPKITGVNKTLRQSNTVPIVFPKTCPECHSILERQEGEALHYCPNAVGCPPQIIGRIQHFISRRAMDIEGLGSETVALLVTNGLIQNYADLYTLNTEDLIPLERMAEKSAENLVMGVQASKTVPFERGLYALGIRYGGETGEKK